MPNRNSDRNGNPPNRIRDFRGRKLWTQEKLAQKAKVSVFTIARAERGYHTPNVISQEKIAHALGVPRDVVFPEEKAS